MKLFKSVFALLFFQLSAFSLSITTSGGVSLGSYKAGFHYYLMKYIKKNNLKVSHFSGASAGSLNSLISLENYCSSVVTPAPESLYWKAWYETGINNLYKLPHVTPISVFNRDPMEEIFSEVKKNLKTNQRKDCNVVLSIPVTSLNVFNAITHRNVYSPSMKNFFSIIISSQGLNKAPKISNLIVDKNINSQLLLPFTDNFDHNYSLIKLAVEASGAFPVAFSPVGIKVCEVQEKICNDKKSELRYFADGGVFDNAPLDLSESVAKVLFAENFDKNKHIDVDSSNYAFIDLEKRAQYDEKTSSLFPLIKGYFEDIVKVARASEELKFLEKDFKVVDRIMTGETFLPPMGSPMYAFFGFFDQDFREFDFYLGANDATFFANKFLNSKKNKTVDLPNSVYNKCFQMVINNSQSHVECIESLVHMTNNQKILLQISLNKAFHFCHGLKDVGRFREVCSFHTGREEPFRVITKSNFEHSLDLIDQNELIYILDTLDLYGFKYNDLNAKYSNLKTGRLKVHEALREMLNAIENLQPVEDKPIVGMLNSYMLKNIENVAPNKSVFINIGTALELGYSKQFLEYSKSLNFQSSLLIQDIDSFIGAKADNIALIPNLGISYSPEYLDFKYYKITIAGNVGYQFSSKDQAGQDKCDIATYNIQPGVCSGKVFILSTTLNILDRLNLKFGISFHDQISNSKSSPKNGYLMVGFQFF